MAAPAPLTPPADAPAAPVDPKPSREALAALAPSLRPCLDADLAAAEVQSSDWLTSGNGYAAVILANRSATACRLSGTPRVVAYDARGHVLAFRFVSGTLEAVDPPATATAVALLPNQRPELGRGNAQIMLTWRSQRGGTCTRASRPAARLTLLVGDRRDGGVSVELEMGPTPSHDAAAVAPCNGLVAVRPFEPANEPAYG